MEIIDGKALAKSIREDLKSEVEELKKQGKIPKLAVILVGNDKASQIYVKKRYYLMKIFKCKNCWI